MKHLSVSKRVMEQELQKARDIIAKSEHIALLLPERPDIDCYVAAEALARAGEERGKHMGFLPSIGADAPKAPEACAKVLRPNPLIREFVIGITTEAPVAQLRYEKHDDRIDIILSPRSSPIREDSFSFRDGEIQCDAVIALGVPDIEALPALAGVEPSFFAETPLLVIGNGADQKSYGEVNLVSPAPIPLSETVYSLLAGGAGEKPDADTATLLLAGIMAHTDGFRAPVESKTHAVAAELLRHGAEHARAGAISAGDKPFALRQLTARATVRSKESDDNHVLWSFLTAEDFEKTGRTPADAASISAALAGALGPHRASILLWQDPTAKRVYASLLGERPLLDALASREPGAFQSPSFTLAADYASFLDAEERIASLLREIL